MFATVLRYNGPCARILIVAFVPALIRGTLWFFREHQNPWMSANLGWSEMKHGVVFGVLLAVAFIYAVRTLQSRGRLVE
jgi:uncharacterized membrane protein